MKSTDFGHFLQDGAYEITTPKTPRNWYNYLFNDTYVASFSQVAFGEGFAQDSMGRRIPLVTARQVFLVDADSHQWWTANGLPLSRKYSDFHCEHRPGQSILSSHYDGISSTWSIGLHESLPGEVWDVVLQNIGDRSRRIRMVSYVGTDVDGAYAIQGYNTGVAGWDPELRGVVVAGACAFDDPNLRETYAFMAANQPPNRFDTRRNAFLGVYGNFAEPEAIVEDGQCRNTDCCGEKCCMALEHEIVLEPGEKRHVRVVVSAVLDRSDLVPRATALLSVNSEAEVERATKALGGVRFHTPNESLNHLANVWLPRVCVLGGRWARVRHTGYRDVVSDCDCLATVNAPLSAKDFKRILGFQYANGYAPRTIRDGAIVDLNFADCAVGIPMAAYNIVMELGLDSGFLDEPVPFNDGSEATVYEHCRRAMDFFWGFRGLHGLIRIWGGDWNDCMNYAGLEGRGSSVWLSMAWCYANRLFGELAEATGHTEDAALSRERGREMADIINAVAWDGEYYLCAFKDDGGKIGSHECEEGRVFLINQLWSILGGVVTPERLPKVLHTMDVELHDPLGTLVMKPGYSHIDWSIGYMGVKAPGIHENGGIYLHTMAWKIATEAVLKRNDHLYETLQQTIPVRDDGNCRASEPYMMSNSIFGPQTGYRYGTPGQSWRSASGQWLLKALINFVFGLKPTASGLRLEPCIPAEWPECSIEKTFRNTTYTIVYRHEKGVACNRIASIRVDGDAWTGDVLPLCPGKTLLIEVALVP